MAAAFSNVTSTFIKVLPLLEVESIQVLIYGPHSTQNTFRHCVPFATLWKFQDFYVIQILREINFRESRSFSLQKVQKFIQKINIQSP